MTTITPEKEKIEIEFWRPWMYPKQYRAVFDPARFSVIEASTKSGKTVGCIAWLIEQAQRSGQEGRNYWWVAPIFAQARIAFRRTHRAIPAYLHTTNLSDMTITLYNGATIWFKGADNPDSLYGEDVFAAVMDEATRCKQEAWVALRSTLTATNGPARIIGNVKGRANWAYRMARRAEAGAPGFAYHKITAADAVQAGVLLHEEVEEARTHMTHLQYMELYNADAMDEVPGALWKRQMLDSCRRPAPEMTRIVVAIDPAGSSVASADEVGIIVAGKGIDGDYYILDDLSAVLSPNAWGRRAVDALESYQADRIVAEANFGGEMVEYVLRTIGDQKAQTIPYKAVHASRGKQQRAEPIAALYEQGRVHHSRLMPELEDQLCTWTPSSSDSPDRLDALVWALTELSANRGVGVKTLTW